MGVEAQTETVWEQANRNNLPRLGFINKLDWAGAEVEITVNSIKKKLNCTPLLLNFNVSQLSGPKPQNSCIIDLPSMTQYQYTDDMGIFVDISPVEKTSPYYEKARHLREELILNLAE